MKEAKCKVSAYLDEEEMKLFERQVAARGVGQSAFIREMLGYDVRPRGAPKGKRKAKLEQGVKRSESKRASTKSEMKGRGRQVVARTKEEQLSLLEGVGTVTPGTILVT
jgi:hypothetical protein